MHGYFRSALRWLIVVVVLPNLIFYLVGRFFFLDRPLFNADYAALGACWPWLSAWLRIGGFAVVFLADAITSTGSMYNINPVAGLVALIRAPIGLIFTVVLAFALACLLAAGLGKLADRFMKPVPRNLWLTTALAALVAALAALLPARSSLAHLVNDIVQRDRGYRVLPVPMAAATDSLRAHIAVQEDNVALVVVESWGVLADRSAHQQLIDLFRTPELRRRYRVRDGQVRFRGGTTSGELRELCGVFTDYLVLNEQIIARCLPNQLRRRGYATIALHGYQATYYMRDQWYPRLFGRILFQDSLALTAERCGTQFRGICDRHAFRTFAGAVKGEGKQLVYWLTIDAHTPVDVARLPEMELGTCSAPQDFCLVVAFWRDLLRQLAELAADPAIPRTRFIIVGDHAPAFVLQSRARHLRTSVVPYVELVPR